MKKINVKDYAIKVNTPEGLKSIPYSVIMSIENVVLATGEMTSQRLSMADLLHHARIIDKMKTEADKGFVLLEEAEYNTIRQAFDSFKGFGINEVELCKRIAEAETVDVEVKKKK